MRSILLLPISIVYLSVLLQSCNVDRVQQTPELKTQMADMRVKRVTNADLSEAVNSWGEQIVAIAEKEAEAKLAANPSMPADSICRLGTSASGASTPGTLPKTQALARRYGMTISLLGAADVQNPTLAAKEREVLDAYLYNVEKKLPQSSNIQRIGDTLFVYNAALPVDSRLCQTCFGNQKQPLGVWRLAFPKREVIRHIKVKKA